MTVIHTVHHAQTLETEITIASVLNIIWETERLAKVRVMNALPQQFSRIGCRVTVNS